MPSPEELGVSPGRPAAAPLDPAAAYRRLEELGATCLQLEKAADGGCRVTCLLPTGQPGRAHRIDVQAAGAAEALRLTVAKAEEWAAGR
jgi:hypothetical protein